MLTATEMRALEERAFSEGVSPEGLMKEAGRGIAEAIRQFFPHPGVCLVVFGKGNNGGDALVAACHLREAGWQVHLTPAFPRAEWGELPSRMYDTTTGCEDYPVGVAPPLRGAPLVIIDGLLGTGARPPLREPLVALAARMNRLREEAGAAIFAIDLPSGMDGDTGTVDETCVRADFTLAIGAPKAGLFVDGAASHVGRIAVVALPSLGERIKEVTGERARAATPTLLAGLLPRRPFESHKGDFGRVAIVAGSRGFTGAAVLTSTACVHAGAGLISLHVDEAIYPIVAASAAPEVMVRPVKSIRSVLETKFDVLVLGPGLGSETREEALDMIRQCHQPMVIDADGLNHLASQMEAIERPPAPRLLTPHPGEMQRLDANAKNSSRPETVSSYTARYPVTLLLKGSRTLVGEAGQPLSYNTTGTPGMATGGMGDVLSGVCGALAGQGLSLYDAARVGAWLCGRAGELAISHGRESEESLTASGLTRWLGRAFSDLRAGCY